jgi:hypothetical protein
MRYSRSGAGSISERLIKIARSEAELNGLMTYDRKVVKFDAARLAELHRRLIGLP